MHQIMRQICTWTLCAGFLLGLHRGRVALWRDGESHPLQIYDIPARTLPPRERLRLEQGIPVESKEELWLLLENFF